MNNTIINIDGIKVIHEIIAGQDTPDVCNMIRVIDEYGNEARIEIIAGKIVRIEKMVK